MSTRQRPLSAAMIQALKDVASGDAYRTCKGRSEHGGRHGTLHALQTRKLITWEARERVITPEGQQILAITAK